MTPQTPAIFSTSPRPPSLHWAIVLALTVVTLGLFGFAWMIVQARFARKIDPANRSLFQILVSAMFFLVSILLSLVVTITVARGGQGTDISSPLTLLRSFQFLLVVTAYLQIRKALTQHYGIKLNGFLAAIFNVYYIQYHLTKLAKEQGVAIGGHLPSPQARSVGA